MSRARIPHLMAGRLAVPGVSDEYGTLPLVLAAQASSGGVAAQQTAQALAQQVVGLGADVRAQEGRLAVTSAQLAEALRANAELRGHIAVLSDEVARGAQVSAVCSGVAVLAGGPTCMRASPRTTREAQRVSGRSGDVGALQQKQDERECVVLRLGCCRSGRRRRRRRSGWRGNSPTAPCTWPRRRGGRPRRRTPPLGRTRAGDRCGRRFERPPGWPGTARVPGENNATELLC